MFRPKKIFQIWDARTARKIRYRSERTRIFWAVLVALAATAVAFAVDGRNYDEDMKREPDSATVVYAKK